MDPGRDNDRQEQNPDLNTRTPVGPSGDLAVHPVTALDPEGHQDHESRENRLDVAESPQSQETSAVVHCRKARRSVSKHPAYQGLLSVDHQRYSPTTQDRVGDLVPGGAQAAAGENTSDLESDGKGTEVTDESLVLSSDVHQRKRPVSGNGSRLFCHTDRGVSGYAGGATFGAPPACRTPGQRNRKAAGPEGSGSGPGV